MGTSLASPPVADPFPVHVATAQPGRHAGLPALVTTGPMTVGIVAFGTIALVLVVATRGRLGYVPPALS